MQIRIIDTTTGKEPTDEVIEKIAKENKLQLFDIDGFGINEDGQIILMDDCGNYAFADNTRFEAKLVEEKREQEPKIGHWEWVQYDANPEIGNFHCSECRYIPASFNMSAQKLNYCPNCGAKMENGKGEL